MKRIPYKGNPLGVFDNLVAAQATVLARQGHAAEFVVRFPSSIGEFRQALVDLFSARLGLSAADVLHFADRLLAILTSCPERRLAEYEKIAWWDFMGAAGRSEAYQQYLAEGLTRSLVAMKAEIGNTRTVGDILIQLLVDAITPGESLDRLLNGPTNDVWLTPWREYLTARGVTLHLHTKVLGLEVENALISKVRVADLGDGAHDPPVNEREISADYYVLALPVEVAAPLMTAAMVAVDPQLEKLSKLQYRWMNGIQFYLRNDVPLVKGHAVYVDSPFALTSISQAQFWTRALTEYGDGSVRGCLSVDISDWETPGILFGKPAMQLSADEIKAEVWAQLKKSLEGYAKAAGLNDDNLAGWHLDRDIRFPNPREDINMEPLLVNVVDSWQFRPEAITRVGNLFLASDYVRTFTDLATMEGANEAARRAVNGILRESRSDAEPCALWPLREPEIFAPFRELDAVRFRLGHPHQMPAVGP
jgi:uncharacterized protein with NAD-binding domain and iron-sulfur cluster